MNGKAKGTTPASLYGKTGKPIQGTIIKVAKKILYFDYPTIAQIGWRALVRDADGVLKMYWFNTYQETNPDGTKTAAYVGEGPDTSKYCMVVSDTADFDSRCASKGYVNSIPAAEWPPQCPFAEEVELEFEKDLEGQKA